MTAVIFEPKPRYVVETANTVIESTVFKTARSPGGWNFRFAFALRSDAETMAARLAEEYEFVRVVDRGTNSEGNK